MVNTITTSLTKQRWPGTASAMLTGQWQIKATTKQPLPPLRQLALWGDVGCGKDTWLATLPVACEKAGRSLQPFDEATAAWQAAAWARLALGDFPHLTPPPSAVDTITPVTFTLATTGSWWRRQQTVRLQITPMTGSWWPQVNHTEHPSPDAPAPYHDLAYAAGIICLLDPTADDYTSSAAALITMLDRLDFYRSQWKRNRPLRIALWLTKLDHAHLWRHQAHAEAYARQLFGSHLRAVLTRLQKAGGYQFRWGGCSAIGTVIDQGDRRSNSYWDYTAHDAMGNPRPVQRILSPHSLQPENVWEPLEWVIAPMI